MITLIKNVQVLDGMGKPAFKADVLVKDEKIAAVGSFAKYRAAEIIDGLGAYLAPGFIDINTDSDHYLTLFSNPLQADFLLQGVTTIIGGQCGASLAPLMYGSLESIRDWTDINQINVNWHTLKEFFKTMERRPLGVNFGTLVGHTTIRKSFTGEKIRDLSRNELRIFNSILKKSLEEGAFGFSTGLGYSQNRGTPYSEIKTLVETTAKFKALYATHLRNEKNGLIPSVNETINVAKETGAKVLISHFRALIGSGENYDEALDLIEKNTDKADIYFDVHPFSGSTILISNFLPDWAQEQSKEAMLKDIETPGLKEKIISGLPQLKGEKILITSAPSHNYLVGKTLKEFSQNRNLTIYEGLLQLMKITGLRAVVFYENINLNKTMKAMCHNRAIVASNSASFGESEGFHDFIRPERSYRTFIRFLELVEKENLMPLEKAIHKITSSPAQRLGLKNRGLIKQGYLADLVIFKDAEIREVLVNGKRAVKAGEVQNVLAGRILKRT